MLFVPPCFTRRIFLSWREWGESVLLHSRASVCCCFLVYRVIALEHVVFFPRMSGRAARISYRCNGAEYVPRAPAKTMKAIRQAGYLCKLLLYNVYCGF